MALYFITYDLRGERDYQKLYDELSRFNAVQVLESTWCFNRYNTNAKGLANHFGRFIDPDDGLLIDESDDCATINTNSNPQDIK